MLAAEDPLQSKSPRNIVSTFRKYLHTFTPSLEFIMLPCPETLDRVAWTFSGYGHGNSLAPPYVTLPRDPRPWGLISGLVVGMPEPSVDMGMEIV